MPFDLSKGAPQRIAVVGGGISGLASAWLLSRHHRVTLFEAAPRLGGHARTVLAGRHGDQPVDTGFIVFNHVNYPHLTAMFRDLDVPIRPSDMSFGVSLDGGRVEYALRDLGSLFGQRRRLADPGFYLMIRDILRFNAGAETMVGDHPGLTIAGLVDRMRLGRRFRDHYLFPFCGAIWSTPDEEIGDFPAEALVRFMRNHGLLSREGQHAWWTVAGGSVAYVDRLADALRRADVILRTGAPVASVARNADGTVSVRAAGGLAETFDHVVLATHADRTLAMLTDADPGEHSALSAVRFQDNRAVLHRDPSVMPRRRRCWSSWVSRGDSGGAVGVTYWMNRLQGIPDSDPLFVTLNPVDRIDPASVYDETTFRHPVFNHAALRAQARLAGMQGRRGTWFAGAWLRNGFHEDGFASAQRIARRLLPATVPS
jgi:predicted NAD/FAD-binding protein